MDEFYREQIEEFEKAWDDFFDDRSKPESEEKDLRQQEKFIQWYNTEREQSGTGMTPEETGTMFGFEREEPPTDRVREAEAYLGREEFIAAGEIADEILEHDPENQKALQISTQSRIMEGDFDRANEILDRWESLNIDDPYTFLHRATLYIMKMDLQSALEEVDEALEIESDLFDAVIMKAQILDFMGDERFEDVVEKARGLDEERTEMFLDGGWLTDYVGEEKEWGSPRSSKLQRVFSLIRSGETEKARGLIPEIKEMESSSDIEGLEETINRVEFDTLLRKGKIDEVDEKVKTRLEQEPKNTLYLYYSAQVPYLKGDMEEARQRIDECISVIEEKEDDAVSMLPFEYFSLKAEILRVIGDEDWERWYEKAERSRRDNLKKDENSGDDGSREWKEKTLDEFL